MIGRQVSDRRTRCRAPPSGDAPEANRAAHSTLRMLRYRSMSAQPAAAAAAASPAALAGQAGSTSSHAAASANASSSSSAPANAHASAIAAASSVAAAASASSSLQAAEFFFTPHQLPTIQHGSFHLTGQDCVALARTVDLLARCGFNPQTDARYASLLALWTFVHRYHFNVVKSKAHSAAHTRHLESQLQVKSGLFSRSQYMQMLLQMKCLSHLSADGLTLTGHIPQPTLDIMKAFTKQSIVPNCPVDPHAQAEILKHRQIQINTQVVQSAGGGAQSAALSAAAALAAGTSISSLVANDPAIAFFQNNSLQSLSFPPNNKQLDLIPSLLGPRFTAMDPCTIITEVLVGAGIQPQPNIDILLLKRERDRMVKAQMKQRKAEIDVRLHEIRDSHADSHGAQHFQSNGWGQGGFGAGTSYHQSQQANKPPLWLEIDSLGLGLVELQRKVRSRILRTLPVDTIVRDAYRSRKDVEAYQRVRDKAEKKTRLATERHLKKTRRNYLAAIANHCRDFQTHHRELHKKLCKAVCAGVIKYWEDREKRALDYEKNQEKARLALLKDNNEEAYVAMLKEAKNERLLSLLKQTDEYMAELSKQITQEQDEHAAKIAIEGDEYSRHKPTADGHIPSARELMNGDVFSSSAGRIKTSTEKMDDEQDETPEQADRRRMMKREEEERMARQEKEANSGAAAAAAAASSSAAAAMTDVAPASSDAAAASSDAGLSSAAEHAARAFFSSVAASAAAAPAASGDPTASNFQSSRKQYYSLAHKTHEVITEQPKMLKGGQLRAYQMEGLQWLVSLYNNRLNGILADEMGLGKTVQSLSLIAYLMEVKHNYGPFLIIVPMSTLHNNWEFECDRWLPGLSKVVYDGDKDRRKYLRENFIKPGHFNIIMTTFEFAMRDKNVLRKIPWKYIIIDEAHRLKNPSCFTADTQIAMANGFSRPICSVAAGTRVLSYDAKLDGHKPVATSHLLYQGLKSCVELLFNDGRTVTCTLDHRFMQPDSSWIEAQHMQLHKSEIVAGVEYPTLLEEPASDGAWTLRLSEFLTYDLDMQARSEHALAFAGILGYLVAGSHCVDAPCGAVLLDHSLDVDWMLRDICLLTDESAATSSPLRVQLPVALHRALLAVGLSASGLSSFPSFLLRPDCPLAVLQAFLGGLFGRAGQSPKISGQSFSGVQLSLPHFGSNLQKTQLTEQLQAMFKRVGIEDCAFNLSSDATLRFASTIGFRYCCHKAMRLTAAVLFHRMQERSSRLGAFDGVNGLDLSLDSALDAFDVAKFFTMHHNAVPAGAKALPTCRVQLIARRAVEGMLPTFDLTVPRTHNFLANALTAHNCKLAQELATYPKEARRVALTGTPLQNDLVELWSLLNFLHPHIFNSSDSFEKWFSTPFDRMPVGTQDKEREMTMNEEEKLLVINRLHSILRPFMLRREKKQVESDLADKIEKVLRCELTPMQKAMYEAVLEGKVTMHNKIMQLRKIANHPILFHPYLRAQARSEPYTPDESLIKMCGKFGLLDQILHKLKRTGHRVLIFNQMTKVMDILEDYCKLRSFTYLRLDGGTNAEDRTQSLLKYNAKDSPYFLFMLSTRAGGLGLNLQSADTVILFDSDWNPQNDAQAMARSHRIGQKSQVIVLRFITTATVEEKVLTTATTKLSHEQMVIQAGMFHEKYSHNASRAIAAEAMAREQKMPEGDTGDDEADQWTDGEISRTLARSDAELALFLEMDAQSKRDEAALKVSRHLPDGRMPQWAFDWCVHGQHSTSAEQHLVPFNDKLLNSARAKAAKLTSDPFNPAARASKAAIVEVNTSDSDDDVVAESSGVNDAALNDEEERPLNYDDSSEDEANSRPAPAYATTLATPAPIKKSHKKQPPGSAAATSRKKTPAVKRMRDDEPSMPTPMQSPYGASSSMLTSPHVAVSGSSPSAAVPKKARKESTPGEKKPAGSRKKAKAPAAAAAASAAPAHHAADHDDDGYTPLSYSSDDNDGDHAMAASAHPTITASSGGTKLKLVIRGATAPAPEKKKVVKKKQTSGAQAMSPAQGPVPIKKPTPGAASSANTFSLSTAGMQRP